MFTLEGVLRVEDSPQRQRQQRQRQQLGFKQVFKRAEVWQADNPEQTLICHGPGCSLTQPRPTAFSSTGTRDFSQNSSTVRRKLIAAEDTDAPSSTDGV